MTLRPDRKHLSVMRIRLLLTALLPMLLCGLLSAFAPVAAAVLSGLLLAVFLWAWVWYLPRYLDSCRVILADGAIAVCRGVFLKKKYILPSPRTVYCERVTTPIGSLFGLKAVNIHLVRHRLSVDGLSAENAELMLSCLSGEVKNG